MTPRFSHNHQAASSAVQTGYRRSLRVKNEGVYCPAEGCNGGLVGALGLKGLLVLVGALGTQALSKNCPRFNAAEKYRRQKKTKKPTKFDIMCFQGFLNMVRTFSSAV